jgi:hypothetical protein
VIGFEFAIVSKVLENRNALNASFWHGSPDRANSELIGITIAQNQFIACNGPRHSTLRQCRHAFSKFSVDRCDSGNSAPRRSKVHSHATAIVQRRFRDDISTFSEDLIDFKSRKRDMKPLFFYLLLNKAKSPLTRLDIPAKTAVSALCPCEFSQRWPTMEIDTEKIDEAVLALLYLTLHDGARAWKGFDWDTLSGCMRRA